MDAATRYGTQAETAKGEVARTHLGVAIQREESSTLNRREPPNSALQRTRLRSPLSAVSLGPARINTSMLDVAPPQTDGYLIPGPFHLFAAGLVALVMAAWGMASLSWQTTAAPSLFLLPVGLVSILIWIPAAEWFRTRNVSFISAGLLGAASSFLISLVFPLFGLVIFQQPVIAAAFGATTGFSVQYISTARRPSNRVGTNSRA